MLKKILNKQYQVNFVANSKKFLLVSLCFMVASVILVMQRGLNLGIDFSGGIVIEVRFSETISLKDLRSGLNDLQLGDIALQDLGNPQDIMIRVGLDQQSEKEQLKKVSLIKEYLKGNFTDQIEFRRSEFVGPTVGNELIRSGFFALLFAFAAIMIYISIRFNFSYGFGALLALLHDVTLTLGLFVLLHLEFNLTAIAAILTIIGYSINDSVVIYDRVRENARKYRSRKAPEIINLSINETLNRTILTALTTMVALLALVFLGGAVLKTFSVSVLFGVIIGTYSSIMIATNVISTKTNEDS